MSLLDDSLDDGAALVGEPWGATPAQEWAFFLLPNGYWAVMNLESTLFLQASGPDDPGAIYQDGWNATANQQWFLYPLGGDFYALVSVASGLMLTDPEAGGDGTALSHSVWTDDLDQWWCLYFLYK